MAMRNSVRVGVAPGSAIAAVLCLTAAVPAGWKLRRAVGRSGGPVQLAYLLLLTGLVIGAGSPVVAAIAGVAIDVDNRGQRMGLAAATSSMCGVGAAVLLAGLLYLPGIADSASARLRQLLDGVLLAGGLVFLVWVGLVSAHAHTLLTTAGMCLVVAVPIAVASAIGGIVLVVAIRAPRPRGGLALLSVGVGLVAAGGAGSAAWLCLGVGGLLVVSGLVLAAGVLLVAFCAPYGDRIAAPEDGTYKGGMLYPILCVIAVVSGSAVRISTVGSLDSVGFGIGVVIGIALVARLALAVREERTANSLLAGREAHFRELAHTDPLTELANRRGLLRALREQAVGGPPCVLLALDLDGFKNVNDMRGHDVGDEVLVEVAKRLRHGLRPGDVAARLGGDEFAVLMWARPDEAERVAHRLLDVLSVPYQREAGTLFMTASMGLAGCATADDVHTLLRNADLALRIAKQRGKARIEQYDPTYDQLLRRQTTLETELRGAIARDELYLAFQPVVSLPSTRPVGAEALLRWRHPELGQIAPTEFIPVAEDAGLAGKLGLWVLHRACRELARWHAEGHDVWVSVNVSIRELHSPAYVDNVTDVLRTHGVPPQRLVLEVTEHQVAIDVDAVVQRLASLRAAGVRIALDDFGAGYSSLGQLHRLPVDILKIDRSLLDQSTDTAPLISVVVQLGHRLGLTVIAEGVEEVGQRRLLEDISCPLAQGHLFGYAMPAEHLEARLASAAPMPPPRRESLPRRDTPPRRAQHMGPVDSGREMRQA